MYDPEKIIARANEVILTLTGGLSPEAVIILGSGLNEISKTWEEVNSIPYGYIPGFPVSKIKGHDGVLKIVKIEGKLVYLFCGRSHLYEGVPSNKLGFAVRLAHKAGAKYVLSTCAVGALKEEYFPGTIVTISDHINLSGENPLAGVVVPEGYERFPGMSTVYSFTKKVQINDIAKSQFINSRQGVYAYVSGPTYETPAEAKMLALLGADIVGMSLVPEAVTAAQLKMEFSALGCVTNYTGAVDSQELNHDDVIVAAKDMLKPLAKIITLLFREV